MAQVRAKFRVDMVTLYGQDRGEVKLSAVTADGIPENERFHKYTPSGSITLSVDNPPAFKALKEQLGKFVYVDFTPTES